MSVNVSEQFIERAWYQKTFLSYCLFPFSLSYRFIIFIRHFLYQHKIFSVTRVNAPVIVVGNITVGGTGKTPLVIALVNFLKTTGFRPGVVTRGYRKKSKTACIVKHDSDPIFVGDEAVLIAKNTNVPVISGANRSDNAKLLIKNFQCNVVISDDGLQHYALARDIEIVVIDSSRRYGNGFCLPAGPLREPVSRLTSVNMVVANGATQPGEFSMQFILDDVVSVLDENKKISFAELMHKKIIVVAGIGNPERFFRTLQLKNLCFERKIFPDHYPFQKKDFDVVTADIILMTEKDAVKCRAFADTRFFYVRGHAQVDSHFFTLMTHHLLQNNFI